MPIGCYDEAEICELAGFFYSNQLGPVIDRSDTGLYRDNSLGIFGGISKLEIKRKKKETDKTFKQRGLSITIKLTWKTVNFLDITFDFQNNIYKPYGIANDKFT